MATLYSAGSSGAWWITIGDHISGRRRITCQIAWGVNISLPPELLDTPEATGAAAALTDTQTANFLRNGSAWALLSAVPQTLEFCQIATGGIRTCLYSIQVKWQSSICLNKTDSDRFLRTLSQDLEEFQDRWLMVIDHSKGGILCFADWKWL